MQYTLISSKKKQISSHKKQPRAIIVKYVTAQERCWYCQQFYSKVTIYFARTQFTIRNGRGRFGIPGSDRKPLVLSTYLDAQEHLPYADDSNAVTPMSEENGAIIVPVYYANLGKCTTRCFEACARYTRSHLTWNIRSFIFNITQRWLTLFAGSRHSSYTSHQSRISYTSHGDLLGTKEQKLRSRSSRNQSMVPPNGNHVGDSNHKGHRDFVRNFYNIFLDSMSFLKFSFIMF